jgi:hypothetical protein
MKKFDFLIGDWTLKYTVPKSSFSIQDSGDGQGTFARALNDKYVVFNYKAKLTSGSAQAHGIFAKDEKHEIYRYWWFEDSGNYLAATCNFVNDKTLFLNWHDSLLIQTFKLVKKDYIELKMSHPIDSQNFELILKVEFNKKYE